MLQPHLLRFINQLWGVKILPSSLKCPKIGIPSRRVLAQNKVQVGVTAANHRHWTQKTKYAKITPHRWRIHRTKVGCWARSDSSLEHPGSHCSKLFLSMQWKSVCQICGPMHLGIFRVIQFQALVNSGWEPASGPITSDFSDLSSPWVAWNLDRSNLGIPQTEISSAPRWDRFWKTSDLWVPRATHFSFSRCPWCSVLGALSLKTVWLLSLFLWFGRSIIYITCNLHSQGQLWPTMSSPALAKHLVLVAQYSFI